MWHPPSLESVLFLNLEAFTRQTLCFLSAQFAFISLPLSLSSSLSLVLPLILVLVLTLLLVLLPCLVPAVTVVFLCRFWRKTIFSNVRLS